MKIISVAANFVEPLAMMADSNPGGVKVTVVAFFADREEVEADDVARLTNMLREAAGDEVSRGDTASAVSRDAAPVPLDENTREALEEIVKPKRKRRTKAEMEAARASEAAKEEDDGTVQDSEGGGGAMGEGEEAPRSRRRRRGAETTEPSGDDADGSAEDGADDSPPPRRRRRRGNSDDAVGGEDNAPRGRQDRASDTSDDGAGGDGESAGRSRSRRRRTSGSEEEGDSGSGEAERKISASDLTKAASAAGQVITPAAVMEYLQTAFGVSSLDKLGGNDKALFIDGLKALVEEES